jgi:hypothetical protein
MKSNPSGNSSSTFKPKPYLLIYTPCYQKIRLTLKVRIAHANKATNPPITKIKDAPYSKP